MSTDSISSSHARRSYQQELAPSAARDKGRSSRSSSSEEAKAQKRRSKRRNEPSAEPPPASPPPEATTQPVGTPTPAPSESRTLAERYVAQYEAQSGNTLTAEQRTAKIADVEQFYDLRQGRLEKIVFA